MDYTCTDYKGIKERKGHLTPFIRTRRGRKGGKELHGYYERKGRKVGDTIKRGGRRRESKLKYYNGKGRYCKRKGKYCEGKGRSAA